jgi:hypothetical protein
MPDTNRIIGDLISREKYSFVDHVLMASVIRDAIAEHDKVLPVERSLTETGFKGGVMKPFVLNYYYFAEGETACDCTKITDETCNDIGAGTKAVLLERIDEAIELMHKKHKLFIVREETTTEEVKA